MLIAVERLLLKVRQPASRVDELVILRGRLRAERATQPSEAERTLAAELRERKRAVTAELHDVTSCASCAKGAPWPRGQYDGGDCCAGVTNELFDEVEVAALVHAGTRVRDLVPPRDPHAGCTFRGATGCSLELEHRPARCVRYVCDTLSRELHARGRLDVVEARLAELEGSMRAFAAAHRARVDSDVLAPLIDALGKATRR